MSEKVPERRLLHPLFEGVGHPMPRNRASLQKTIGLHSHFSLNGHGLGFNYSPMVIVNVC